MKKKKYTFSRERLRDISWEIGHKYPLPLTGNYIDINFIHPRLAFLHWHVSNESLHLLREQRNEIRHGALAVRLYDVTDLIFNGFNAHSHTDIDVNGETGNYYFQIGRLSRNYLAEIGIRATDGSYNYLARSETRYFDSDRPTGNFNVKGMFAGGALKRNFSIENIFDAPIYEKMNRKLADTGRHEALSVATILPDMSGENRETPLSVLIMKVSKTIANIGGAMQLFRHSVGTGPTETLTDRVKAMSGEIEKSLIREHKKRGFHIIHCHEWYALPSAMETAGAIKVPVVLSLHSTEHERSHGNVSTPLSHAICDIEGNGVKKADLIVVPHSYTRQQVINFYGADGEKVVIVPDIFEEKPLDSLQNTSETKAAFGLNGDAPLALFAGEISHISGADLLMESIPTVCSNNSDVQFLFVGDGPLKGELEGRAWHGGLGHRCKFTGEISGDAFESILLASDFVIIPARTWQDDGLAQMAIDRGKPVLTTHQAGINCISHGETGIVTYDNPGSIVWGVQEMLSNPLEGNMLKVAARKKSEQIPSIETIAAQYYMYYEIAIRSSKKGGTNA